MGRPERPLDPTQGPLADFAHDLRALRHKAGTPNYRQMAAEAHFSATALSRAASGKALPSLEVTLAFVAACGGDTRAWKDRWHAVRAELRGEAAEAEARELTEAPPASAADPVPASLSASPSRLAPDSGPASALDRARGRRRLWVAAAVVIGLAATGGAAAALLPAASTAAHPAHRLAAHAARRPAASPARTMAAADARDDDNKGRPRPVLREGVVTLRTNQIIDFDDRSWPTAEASRGNPYDLEFTSDKRTLDSIGSDDITILPPGSHGTRAECGAQQNYSEPVTPALDRPGTFFCLITDTRRYVLCRIAAVTRDASGRPAEVRLYAVIWEPREAD
ncbi:helix-turn-helix transcriptional regulator [Actinoallomurus sp. NPDC050550]|uniref:helix-turn-helix domain-containing protein n=1 Tax=Actinoallomurus sp. NPDC050550 TaxID=3154937 RepID=UPI0033C0E5D9